MSYDENILRRLFDKTDGCCHLCGKPMAWANYGKPGRRGAWEVDHSKPRTKGGSGHCHNLYPAHVRCNREKQDKLTRSIRQANGLKRAPDSKQVKAQRQLTERSFIAVVLTGLAALVLAR